MPPHVHYVEPYGGGLAVLLAKSPEGVSEVVNDLHSDLTTFWRVLQDVDQFARFCRAAAPAGEGTNKPRPGATPSMASAPFPRGCGAWLC